MPRLTRRKLVGKIDRIMQQRRADELTQLIPLLRQEWQHHHQQAGTPALSDRSVAIQVSLDSRAS